MLIDFFWFPTLVVAALAAVLVGIVGVFSVARKTSYVAGSIAHSAFGGLGLAFAFDFSPLLGAGVFAVFTAIAVVWIKQRFKAYEDILLNGIWAFGMAVGILALHFTEGYAPDLFAYLFGNILLANGQDAILLGVALVCVSALVYFLYTLLQAVSFDEEYANVLNLPVKTVSIGMMVITALVTVLLLKVMGVILVVCLIALPAAAALQLTHHMRYAILLSIGFSLFAVLGGTLLAIFADFPPTPVIVLLSLFALGASFLKKVF